MFPAPEVLSLVPGGAVSSGHVADAVVSVDKVEVARRRACGLVSVESLTALDALLSLPLGVPVGLSDVGERLGRVVQNAAPGVVDVVDGTVVRRLRVPLTVHGVVVQGRPWAAAMRAAHSFGPFAQRVVVVNKVPSSVQLWDAQLCGVGVWVSPGSALDGADEVGVVLAPSPFRASQFKAVGWRFAERAMTRLAASSAD